MATYHFDVQVSDHDSLKQGVTARKLYGSEYDWHRIVVTADNNDDAHWLAAAMASRHGMVTSLAWRI